MNILSFIDKKHQKWIVAIIAVVVGVFSQFSINANVNFDGCNTEAHQTLVKAMNIGFWLLAHSTTFIGAALVTILLIYGGTRFTNYIVIKGNKSEPNPHFHIRAVKVKNNAPIGTKIKHFTRHFIIAVLSILGNINTHISITLISFFGIFIFGSTYVSQALCIKNGDNRIGMIMVTMLVLGALVAGVYASAMHFIARKKVIPQAIEFMESFWITPGEKIGYEQYTDQIVTDCISLFKNVTPVINTGFYYKGRLCTVGITYVGYTYVDVKETYEYFKVIVKGHDKLFWKQYQEVYSTILMEEIQKSIDFIDALETQPKE